MKWSYEVDGKWICRHCGIRDEWDVSEKQSNGTVACFLAHIPRLFASPGELAVHYRLDHPRRTEVIDYLQRIDKESKVGEAK